MTCYIYGQDIFEKKRMQLVYATILIKDLANVVLSFIPIDEETPIELEHEQNLIATKITDSLTRYEFTIPTPKTYLISYHISFYPEANKNWREYTSLIRQESTGYIFQKKVLWLDLNTQTYQKGDLMDTLTSCVTKGNERFYLELTGSIHSIENFFVSCIPRK